MVKTFAMWPQQQWSLNPQDYVNVPNTEVDWAALAKQWMAKKEDAPEPPPPATPGSFPPGEDQPIQNSVQGTWLLTLLTRKSFIQISMASKIFDDGGLTEHNHLFLYDIVFIHFVDTADYPIHKTVGSAMVYIFAFWIVSSFEPDCTMKFNC